jgi:hypothetical protein
MTEPLLAFLEPPDREALFVAFVIGGAEKASVRRLWPRSLTQRLKGFIARHSLEPFALNMLRTTRINRVYLKSGNVLLANKIARHKLLKTTIDYLNHVESAERERAIIADVQAEIVSGTILTNSGIVSDRPPPAEPARSTERDCADPYDAPAKAKSVGGALCQDWLFPLNDPGLVIPDDPVFLAALLRDRDELREAQLRMNNERFARLYAPKLGIIENDILPQFSAERLEEARTLIPQLPAARRIA